MAERPLGARTTVRSVIDLQCLARSAIFGWLANGQLTVGLDETREGARGFYDVSVRRASFHTHAVDWYLSVLPTLGIPVDRDFQWMPARAEVAAEVRRKWPLSGARWVLFQPGARWATKRWPAENYAELMRQVLGRYPDVRCAILGGADDRLLGERLGQVDSTRCLDLTGKTSLPEMVEWIRACELMVTNDTGPMHVAAALGKPLVSVFGPTEPRRTGPYGRPGDVLQLELPCSPCLRSRCFRAQERECLRMLLPSVVFHAVEARLAAPFAACHCRATV